MAVISQARLTWPRFDSDARLVLLRGTTAVTSKCALSALLGLTLRSFAAPGGIRYSFPKAGDDTGNDPYKHAFYT